MIRLGILASIWRQENNQAMTRLNQTPTDKRGLDYWYEITRLRQQAEDDTGIRIVEEEI